MRRAGGDLFSAVVALFGLLVLGLWLAAEGLRCLRRPRD